MSLLTKSRYDPTNSNMSSPISPRDQRARSPHHIIHQAMAPAPLQRKPVDDQHTLSPTSALTNHDPSSMMLNGAKYSFDDSPNRSQRTSYIDPAMDPQVRLEEYDWAELEDQFTKRMEAFRAVEEGIMEDWKAWGELFGAWASTISVHDEERASKRLRTRIAYTQGSEENLEQKRQHYIKVVQAFEAALALMG